MMSGDGFIYAVVGFGLALAFLFGMVIGQTLNLTEYNAFPKLCKALAEHEFIDPKAAQIASTKDGCLEMLKGIK